MRQCKQPEPRRGLHVGKPPIKSHRRSRYGRVLQLGAHRVGSTNTMANMACGEKVVRPLAMRSFDWAPKTRREKHTSPTLRGVRQKDMNQADPRRTDKYARDPAISVACIRKSITSWAPPSLKPTCPCGVRWRTCVRWAECATAKFHMAGRNAHPVT